MAWGAARGEGRRINKQFTLSFLPGFAYLKSHLIATRCLHSCTRRRGRREQPLARGGCSRRWPRAGCAAGGTRWGPPVPKQPPSQRCHLLKPCSGLLYPVPLCSRLLVPGCCTEAEARGSGFGPVGAFRRGRAEQQGGISVFFWFTSP